MRIELEEVATQLVNPFICIDRLRLGWSDIILPGSPGTGQNKTVGWKAGEGPSQGASVK